MVVRTEGEVNFLVELNVYISNHIISLKKKKSSAISGTKGGKKQNRFTLDFYCGQEGTYLV